MKISMRFPAFGFKNIKNIAIIILSQTIGVLLTMTGTKTSPEGQEKNDWVWIGKSRTDPYWQRCATHFDISTYDNIYDAVAEKLIHGPVRALVINGAGFASELPALVQTILSKELARSILIYNPLSWSTRDDFFPAGDLRVRKVDNVTELAEVLAHLSAETREPEKTESSVQVQPEDHPSGSQLEIRPAPLLKEGSSAPERGSEIFPIQEKSTVIPWPMEPPAVEPSVMTESASLDQTQMEAGGQNGEWSEQCESQEDEDKVEPEEMADALDLDKLSPKGHQKVSGATRGDAEMDEGDFHLAQLTSEELDALLGFEPDTKEHK